MSNGERYGVGELAEAADVSVRTVRYYIAEGLLPPPVTAGARSYYTRDHLDRLRAIGRLKEAYLPLREIRRQLTTLDDATIRELADEAVAVAEQREPDAESHTISEARDAPYAAAPPRAPKTARPGSASDYIARVLGSAPETRPPKPVTPPSAPHGESKAEQIAWRRLAIGDDAELLIREDAYLRRRDKIDWLIDWTRKVLE